MCRNINDIISSNFSGNAETLELGSEVEYALGRSNCSGGGCASADMVRSLPAGTIPIAKPLEPILHGNVIRTMRALNPDQTVYSGTKSIANFLILKNK